MFLMGDECVLLPLYHIKKAGIGPVFDPLAL